MDVLSAISYQLSDGDSELLESRRQIRRLEKLISQTRCVPPDVAQTLVSAAPRLISAFPALAVALPVRVETSL